MKRLFFIFVVIFVLIINVSCKKAEIHNKPSESYDPIVSLNEQTLEQLRVQEPTEKKEETEAGILNFDDQTGMWFTYMDYADILKGKNEEDFTQSVSSRFENAKKSGINTLYLHVRAFNDSYYKSKIFPKGEYYDADYDPLEIMINEAHKLGLSVHAWINPLRCQTDEQLKRLDESYTIKKWYDSDEKNGAYIVNIENNWYLNPAYTEVRSYISDGVKEIVQNYKVDGLHIDDYFYPTSEKTFDAAAFSESGSENLDEWRKDNINKMIKEIYSVIKAEDKNMLFGISPQGNINANYSSRYADVKKWASELGFCDYIVPQIYFGFENESCPFKDTVKLWREINSCKEVKLIIGLCTYKIGNEDKWAGSGKNEWKENRNIVSEQIQYCAENDLNISVYSYSSTFSEEIAKEQKSISETIRKYGGE